MEDDGFNYSSDFVRVGVKSGGCSGLSYDLKFDNKLLENDKVFEDNDIKSKVYWFDGEEYILIKINKTELIDNTVFIDLVDQEVGNVEMEVYFVDANSISGFYAGQFRFKGERIK